MSTATLPKRRTRKPVSAMENLPEQNEHVPVYDERGWNQLACPEVTLWFIVWRGCDGASVHQVFSKEEDFLGWVERHGNKPDNEHTAWGQRVSDIRYYKRTVRLGTKADHDAALALFRRSRERMKPISDLCKIRQKVWSDHSIPKRKREKAIKAWHAELRELMEKHGLRYDDYKRDGHVVDRTVH